MLKNTEKIIELIQEKETELNIYVIEYKADPKGDVHFLCKRESRGDYAVWSAFSIDKAFDNFYSGFYTENLMDAINEFKNRLVKDIDMDFYSYNGFSEPLRLATSLNEFKENVVIKSNYLGSIEQEVIGYIEDIMNIHYFERDSFVLSDVIDDLKDILLEYGIFVNPELKELQEFNVSKCLDKNAYLDEFIEVIA